MSIETMTFVNVIGNYSYLNEFLYNLMNFKMFHIEKIKKTAYTKNFKILNEQNPHLNHFNKIKKIIENLKIEIKNEDFINFSFKDEYDENFLNDIYEKIMLNEKNKVEIIEKINNLKNSFNIVSHIKNFNSNIDVIFKANHIDVYFGKMPLENYSKLNELKDENFFFIPQDKDENFLWGFYISKKTETEKAMDILKEINFVEYKIASTLTGNPNLVKNNIIERINTLKDKLKELETENLKMKNENKLNILKSYYKLKILNDIYNYRKFALVDENKKFNICGFVPTSKLKIFNKIFNNTDEIVFEFLQNEKNKDYSPPVKLKTCKLFKPFEMYVLTYGVPQYGSINPSGFIGLIYSLIFGIMFGDCGQGLILFLAGLFAWKKKKNKLGLILTRCGISSIIFGFLFDSIFGFEGLLKNFWNMTKISSHLPFHLLKPSNSIPILIISCAIGMFLILISISINIFLNIKSKNFAQAIFSHNGLAGLLAYGGFVVASLFLILFKKNIFSPIFIVLIIIVPLVAVFFSIPLSNLLEKKSNLDKTKKEKFTISSAFFNMIDILLSYFTNTLSFLRIGGLALSHAALMLVVMKFAQMASFASPVVIIFGNAFVILLEGLIVSIQALRLIYYEIFSRFYKSNGKPFTPIKLDF